MAFEINFNNSQRVITNKDNTFFTNNKIVTGTEKPTSGSFEKGDIVVNIGSNNSEEHMWVCVESGEPGTWEAVGSGTGGSSLVSINESVFVNAAVNEVSLGKLVGIISEKDKLIVHFNSIHLMEGIDYRISDDGSKIIKLTNGYWNESNEPNSLFAFELLKNVSNGINNNDNGIFDSKLTTKTNNVVLNGSTNEVEIGIPGYDKNNDMMMVFKNSTFMVEGVDYIISNNSKVITNPNGYWNESNISDYSITFVVFKEVVIYNSSDGITMGMLGTDVKNAFNNLNDSITTQNERLEALEEGGIDLSNYQIKTDNSLNTSNKTIVGAINELFQNANNGKELIASAIGEPLDSSDTFSAMSNDINGLLSTFKTNMMKNGIIVESGDKFKSLIDKLIVNEDENEESAYLFNAPDFYDEEFYSSLTTKINHINGYESPLISLKDNANNGVISFTMTGANTTSYTGTNCVLSVYSTKKVDLTNITSIKITSRRTSGNTKTDFGIFSSFTKVGYEGHPDFTRSISIASTSAYNEYTFDTTEITGEHYIGITVTTTTLSNKLKAYVYIQSILLAGIAQKDVLKDSLANILKDKGVEVSPEDDMADLIGKVDSIQTGGGLDIISATELPATGKENQICVITETTPPTFVLTTDSSDITTNNDIAYLITGNSTYGVKLPISPNNITYNLYLTNISQGSEFLDSYYYNDGSWKELTKGYYPVIVNGGQPASAICTFSSDVYYSTLDPGGFGYAAMSGISSGCYLLWTSINKVNFALYSRIDIDLQTSKNHSSARLYLGTSAYSGLNSYNNGTNAYANWVNPYTSISPNTTRKTVTLDITTWTKTEYFGLYWEPYDSNCELKIYNIKFYK